MAAVLIGPTTKTKKQTKTHIHKLLATFVDSKIIFKLFRVKIQEFVFSVSFWFLKVGKRRG
jgi:hypothetical protein